MLVTAHKIPSQQHVDGCLAQYLGIVAQLNGHTINHTRDIVQLTLLRLSVFSPILWLSQYVRLQKCGGKMALCRSHTVLRFDFYQQHCGRLRERFWKTRYIPDTFSSLE